MRNSGSNFFGRNKRTFGNKISPTPGPGSYRMPSDFGFYESTKPGKFKKMRI